MSSSFPLREISQARQSYRQTSLPPSLDAPLETIHWVIRKPSSSCLVVPEEKEEEPSPSELACFSSGLDKFKTRSLLYAMS